MQDDGPNTSDTERDADTPTDRKDALGSSILDEMDAVRVTTESNDDDEASAPVMPERETTPRTQLQWEGPGQIVYEPRIRQVGLEHYAIEGKCEDRNHIAWGFWGALMAVAVMLLVLSSGLAMLSMWDIFWAMASISVGVLLYQFGDRSSLREEVLCEINVPQEHIVWPQGTIDRDEHRQLRFDEVTEIVFGMTRLPVTSSDARVRVDAFTLLVRTPRDKLIPVIEGSPYKEEVHNIGELLGELTGHSMTYVGRGIRD